MSEKHVLICDRCSMEHDLPCSYRDPVYAPRDWIESDDGGDYCPDCAEEMAREEEEATERSIREGIDAIVEVYRG